MASHSSSDDCNQFSALSSVDLDSLASDNIPFEVYSSMAELILSQQNVSACLSQSQYNYPSGIQKSDSTCSQMNDWLQNILQSQNQRRTLQSFPYSYHQSSMSTSPQHNLFEEDALEMDPLPGDLLHELNLKCEIPPGRNTPSPRLSTTSSASGGLLENLYCGDSAGITVKHITNGMAGFCNNNNNTGVILKSLPPALMDLQPEPSERLTERASSLLDAATREGISAANHCNGGRRGRSIRGRLRNSLSQHFKDDATNKPRYQQTPSAVVKGQSAPPLPSFRPDISVPAPNDNDNVFLTEAKALSVESYASYYSGNTTFSNTLINEGSGSGCSSASSSELPSRQALRPTYSDVIKMSSNSAIANTASTISSSSCEREKQSNVVNSFAAAGRQCAGGSSSSAASSNTSPRRSIPTVSANVFEVGRMSCADDNSSLNVLSMEKNENRCSSSSKNAESDSFTKVKVDKADIEPHFVNHSTQEDKNKMTHQSCQFQGGMAACTPPSDVPLEAVLNNAKSLLSVNCTRHSAAGQLHHIIPPPPTASFIANDLKKRSNTEKERCETRGRKSATNNVSSSQLEIPQALVSSSSSSSSSSSTCDQLLMLKKKDSLTVACVAAASETLRPLPKKSSSNKKKGNCRPASNVEKDCAEKNSSFASRMHVFLWVVCWRKSLLTIHSHVQWLLWEVIVFTALAVGRLFFLRIATMATNLALYVAMTTRCGSFILWRRIRYLLPNFTSFNGYGGRHGGGRRKKTGSRKPAWMPPGLQAHIELPDTCEDAMKRLLACKEKDAYSILGVRRDAHEDEIAHYYKRQALLVHPDKNVKPGAGEAFKILSRAFELVGGSVEQRREYDAALETARMQSEEAMEQFSGMVTKLQERMEEVMNTLKCDKCGSGHRRHRVEERSTAAARYCAQCRTLHSAREGDLWAEATCFGFRWHYYACMEDGIYNVTDFIACRAEQFKQMMADSHNVLFRLSTANWRRFKKPQDSLEDLMEDLLPSRVSGYDLENRATCTTKDEAATVLERRSGGCRSYCADNNGLRRSKGGRRSRRH